MKLLRSRWKRVLHNIKIRNAFGGKSEALLEQNQKLETLEEEKAMCAPDCVMLLSTCPIIRRGLPLVRGITFHTWVAHHPPHPPGVDGGRYASHVHAVWVDGP